MTIRVKATHMMVLGTTQVGKTRYCNELHRTFPRVSLFVDTKGIDPIWGVHVRSPTALGEPLMRGQKLVWRPPRREDGIDWERADPELLRLWANLQKTAQRCSWSAERPPWFQLVVDEAQQWQGPGRPDTINDIAAMGLGMGVRLVIATQHPAGLKTVTRNNLNTRVVFKLGDEGERCIQSWGWPVEAIKPHVAQPYHFATNDPARGWTHHKPL